MYLQPSCFLDNWPDCLVAVFEVTDDKTNGRLLSGASTTAADDRYAAQQQYNSCLVAAISNVEISRNLIASLMLLSLVAAVRQRLSTKTVHKINKLTTISENTTTKRK